MRSPHIATRGSPRAETKTQHQKKKKKKALKIMGKLGTGDERSNGSEDRALETF